MQPCNLLQELQRNLDRLTQELRSTRLERQDLSEQLLAANAALAEAQASVQEQAGQLDAANAAAAQAEARCGELEVQLQGVERRCAELKAELAEKADEVGGLQCHCCGGAWVDAWAVNGSGEEWVALIRLCMTCRNPCQTYQMAGCHACLRMVLGCSVVELGGSPVVIQERDLLCSPAVWA
jgi:hypothetical protein